MRRVISDVPVPTSDIRPLGIPRGTLIEHAGPNIPNGFLICDGSAISRTKYDKLFEILGIIFGSGDGVNTFNLPDLRGRITVGLVISGGHADVSTLGNNDGVALTYRRPKHRHTPHSHTWGYTGNTGTGPNGNIVSSAVNSYTTASDGGSGNTNDSLDAPAYLVLNRIIKT